LGAAAHIARPQSVTVHTPVPRKAASRRRAGKRDDLGQARRIVVAPQAARLKCRVRPMLAPMLVICAGASVGAIARWLLGLWLNELFPAIPPGTLAANLIGGYLIGLALALFALHPALAPEWRLLVITGFLGGLTTFSTFSAEVTTLLQEGRLLWAGAAISAHVIGSVAMTLLGLATVWALQRH
jgi:CrcB protein